MPLTVSPPIPAAYLSTHAAALDTCSPKGSNRMALLVCLTDAKGKHAVYRLHRLDSETAAWEFGKVVGGTDAEAGDYVVHESDGVMQCECKGYLRHGKCKHVRAVQAIVSTFC